MSLAQLAVRALLPGIGAVCLGGLGLPVRPAAAQGGPSVYSRAPASHSPVSHVIRMQFEVQVHGAAYGLVPGVQIATGDAVLIDVATLGARLAFSPQHIRTWCTTLTATAVAPESPADWPCHASLPRAEAQMGIRVELDLANAALIVRSTNNVPVIRHERLRLAAVSTLLGGAARAVGTVRGASAARESLPTAGNRPAIRSGANIAYVPATQVDYQVSVQRHAPQTGDTVGAPPPHAAWSSFGTMHVRRGILGGALEMALAGGSDALALQQWYWSRRDVTSTGLRLVQVGALRGTSPASGDLWGVGFGNPAGEVYQPREVLVTHRARPDWEYFALVGSGVLKGAREGDGALAFRIPQAGDVASYELIAIAPDGREIRQTRLVHGMSDVMPRGALRHYSTVGQCRNQSVMPLAIVWFGEPACHWRASSDWTFAASTRIHLRAGSEWVDGRWQPFAGLRSVPTPAWRIEGLAFRPPMMSALNDADGVSSRIAASRGMGVNTSLLWNPSPQQLARVSWEGTPDRHTRAVQLLQSLPGAARDIQLGVWWNVANQPALTLETGRLTAALQRGASRFEMFAQHMSAQMRGSMSAAATQTVGVSGHLAPTWWQGPQHPWWLRASVARSVDRREWQHDVRLNLGALGADVELAQSHGTGGWRWSVLVAPRLTRVRMSTSASGAMPGGAGGSDRATPRIASTQTWTAMGSMVHDGRQSGVQWRADRMAGRAAIAATVFLDRNGNGRLDPHERGIPDVAVLAGNQRQRTDDNGRAILTGVSSREPVILSVDSLTLEQPCWVAAPAHHRALLRAAHRAEVEIPVREGTLIEGQLIIAPDVPSLPALPSRLTLTHDDGSRVEVDLFADGWFGTPPLLPGRWHAEVEVGQRTMRGILVTPDPDVRANGPSRASTCRTRAENLHVQ